VPEAVEALREAQSIEIPVMVAGEFAVDRRAEPAACDAGDEPRHAF
jgi:hypothetical protein